MIPVGVVLLRIQHLQQGRAGVAPVIGAHLVDFVQQQHRIAAAGLDHGGHNPAGHGADVGFPVSPDVRLVVDAAQGNPGHFPVQAPGDGVGNGGFAHAGRADQADDLGRHIRRHFPHGDGFQNPFLDLLQSKVVVLQYLPGGGNVHPLLCLLIPGQFQYRVQIIAQNRALGGAEGLLLHAVYVLQQLLFRVFRQLQRLNALGVGIRLVFVVPFAQLFPDDLHLLAQIVVLLALINGCPGFFLNVPFQLKHFQLAPEKLHGVFQTAGGVQLAQQLRLFRKVNSGVLGDGIGKKPIAFAGHHAQLDRLCGMLGHLQIHAVKGIRLPAQRPGTHGIRRLLGTDRFHNALQVRFALGKLGDFRPAQAGDQNPQIFPLAFQNLLDLGDTANGIQVFDFRIIHQQILLGDEQQRLIPPHGGLQRLHGLVPTDLKMHSLLRKNAQPPQRQDWHFPGIHGFCQRNSSF